MEISVGNDLEEVSRMAQWLAKGAGIDRFFTTAELAHAQAKGGGAAETLTGIFCAKEAFCKAVGEGMPLLLRRETEVTFEASGRPVLRLSGETAQRFAGYTFSLSISHTKQYASAVVVAVKQEGRGSLCACLPTGK